jgi:hypothetical protein
MLTYLASIGFSLTAAQSTSFNDSSLPDEQIDPWSIITTVCLGAATLALYSALSAKRVTVAETNQKLIKIFKKPESKKQDEEPRSLTSRLMDCFKSTTHPKSTPCLQMEAVHRTHLVETHYGIAPVPEFNTSDNPLDSPRQ